MTEHNLTMERREDLLEILVRCQNKRVLVIGDLVADRYIYGQTGRVSREAPVLILSHRREEVLPGCAANAVKNLRSLGGVPVVLGVVGDDREGESLLQALEESKVDTSTVVRIRGYRTPCKTRILAGSPTTTRQQVVRVDRAERVPNESGDLRALRNRAMSLTNSSDVVIFSDYGLGTVSESLFVDIRDAARDRDIPVLVDSRHSLLSFRGATAATPNEEEVENALNLRLAGIENTERRNACKELARRLEVKALLITRGSRGMCLVESSGVTRDIPIFGTDEVADVTGAGDTVIAVFSLVSSTGAGFFEAALLANVAGGLVVMKRGTATVSADELRDTLKNLTETTS